MTADPLSSVQHIPSNAALGLAYRVRVPTGDGLHPTLIMIHGLDGTEDVTWVFARAAAPQWLILTPRAPISTAAGSSWYSLGVDGKPIAESFAAGLTALERFIESAIQQYPIDPARIVLLGFSQGSAMAYAYAITHRQQIKGVAALSGFIARLSEIVIPPLSALPVLILHGTQDQTIPIEIAQRARDRLLTAGAHVTYEEAAVGHKISAQGMRTLASWLAERLAAGP